MTQKEPQIAPWIFFDLDDTLWDFSFNSSLSLEYMYENFPVISKVFPVKNDFLLKYHNINAGLWEDFSVGKLNSDELRVERWRRTLFPDNHEKGTIDLCKEIDVTYLRELAQFPNMMEGAETLLEDLTKRHLVGILSNGFPKTQYAKAMNSGLWKYITRLIVSDEINKTKPHPDIFSYCIEETGLKAPFLMVGDNFNADVLGAINAGWHAIWFNPKGKDLPDSIENYKNRGLNMDLLIGITTTLKETGELIKKFFKN